MALLLTVALVLALGLLVLRGPCDTREIERSKEHVLAGYGMTWDRQSRDDEVLAAEWATALRTARRLRESPLPGPVPAGSDRVEGRAA